MSYYIYNGKIARFQNKFAFDLSYCAEATALFARMDVQPGSALRSLINITIESFKSADVWTKIKRLYCRRVHTLQASLLDWKGISDGTAYNNPIFRPTYGVKGDGVLLFFQPRKITSR